MDITKQKLIDRQRKQTSCYQWAGQDRDVGLRDTNYSV